MTIIRKMLGESSPQDLLARADLEWVRDTCPPEKPMSSEMTILMALVIFDGYTLFPSERERHTGGR